MKNKLAFILWILALTALWIFGELKYVSVLLAAAVLAEIFSAICAGKAARRVRIGFELRGSNGGEKTAVLQIVPENLNPKALLPLIVKFKLQTENCLTGEKNTEKFSLNLDSGKTEILIKSLHAGKLRAEIMEIRLTDFFGLAAFRLRAKGEETLTCILLPPASAPLQIPDICYGYEQTGDIYAEDRPGTDQSQVYELRDYRSGDSMREIHWKLSSRGENWIVRSGSFPVGYRLLLLLENSYDFNDDTERPQRAIERACAGIIALSEELTDRGITHYIGWWNRERGSVQTMEISSAENLMEALGEMMGATLEKRGKTILERLYEENGEKEFSQIILIEDETAKDYRI